MENLICKLDLVVEHAENGTRAKGFIEFHGTDIDKAHVVAHILEILEFPTSPNAVLLLMAAHGEYVNNMILRKESCAGVDFVEEAEGWSH